jgi:uncharacterized protein (TIGR02611 family)
MPRILRQGLRTVRRIVVGVLGLSVVAIGVALLVLPGPAFIVIPIGLGILAIEFEWARRWLRRARELYDSAAGNGASPTASPTGSPHPDVAAAPPHLNPPPPRDS